MQIQSSFAFRCNSGAISPAVATPLRCIGGTQVALLSTGWEPLQGGYFT